MSQVTDKKLLNRTKPTNPETDPIVDPDWDDVIPAGPGCELRAPELAVKIGSEPTGPDVEKVGGSETHPTLASEANQPPTPFDSDAESQDEQQLVATITELWSSSKTTKSTIAKSRSELAEVRRELGVRLDAYKTLLTRPGREGKWSAFLREIKIPRATVDRLVEASSRSATESVNRLSEAIPAPTEVDIAKLVSRLVPRLARQLPTPALVARFLHALGDALHGSAPVAADSKRGAAVVPGVTAAS